MSGTSETPTIIIVEFAPSPPTVKEAKVRLAALRLPTDAGLFQTEDKSFFAVLRVPGPLDGCKAITLEGNVAAFFHGTDCNMTRAINTDVTRGHQQPLDYCDRRQAGGVFEAMEVPHD